MLCFGIALNTHAQQEFLAAKKYNFNVLYDKDDLEATPGLPLNDILLGGLAHLTHPYSQSTQFLTPAVNLKLI